MIMIVLILFVSVTGCDTSQKDAIFEAFIAIDDSVLLYTRPDLKSEHISLRNDSDNEDFLQISIIEVNDDWYMARIKSISHAWDGWIHKSQPLYAYSAAYDSDLKVYYSESQDSIKCKLGYFIEPIRLLQIDDDMMRVIIRTNNEICEGWIHIDQLCGSPYTTCN